MGGVDGVDGVEGVDAGVSERILRSCRERDSGARISSILSDSHGRTVVRVRASVENNAVQLLKVLKGLWPLAKTAVVENKLDGTIEAQIVVPRKSDERYVARQRASSSRCAEFLYAAMHVLLIVGIFLYANDVYTDYQNNFWNNTSDQEL